MYHGRWERICVGTERCEGGRKGVLDARSACSQGTLSWSCVCVCVCRGGAACGGAHRGAAGDQGDRETFERRQTLPLSTLTPTISPKKAVNPLLPGQARGKVSAHSQLPSLPRLMPFGQVNSSQLPACRCTPGFCGDLPESPTGVLPPRSTASSRRALLGFEAVCAGR